MKELMKCLFKAAVRLLHAAPVLFIPVFSFMLIWQKENPEGFFMTPINVKAIVIQLVIWSLVFIVLTIRFVINKKKKRREE